MSGQHSVLGDIKTRLCLHIEILSERCIDQCGDVAYRMRKPLIALSAVALLLTMRTAQRSINLTKATGLYDENFGPPGYSAPHDIPGAFGQPGGGPPMQPQKPKSFLSLLVNKLTGKSTSPTGFGPPGYGGGGAFGNTGMGGGSLGSADVSTADLCNLHCRSKTVHVASIDAAKAFLDFGGKSSFGGEIVAVVTKDNVQPVQSVLAEPGQGRVLVIDGGGMSRRGSKTALFDEDLAQLAQNNGWAGILVNGCVRNSAKLKQMSGLGVKALCTSPRRGDGHSLGAMLKSFSGGKHSHVSFASLRFNSRHFVYADGDGILTSTTAISAVVPGGSGFGSGGMSFGSGTSSYGSGGSTFGSGTSSFGSSTGSTYGSGSSMYGGSSTGSTYGGGSGTYGSSSTGSTFGSGGSTYSSGTSTYGSGSTGSTYGSGSGTSTYGSGSGTSTFGSGSGTSTYGSGSGTSTFGSGSGTSTFGSGSGTSTFGSGTSTYGSGSSSTFGSGSSSGTSMYGSGTSGSGSTYGSGSSTYGSGTSTYGSMGGGSSGSTYGSGSTSTFGSGSSTGSTSTFGGSSQFGGGYNLRKR